MNLRSFRTSTVASLLILALVVGAAAGYFIGSRSTIPCAVTSVSTSITTSKITVVSPSISTSTVESVSTTTTIMSPIGTNLTTTTTASGETVTVISGSTAILPSLQLTAALSPAIAAPGQNVSVWADVYNSVPDNVSLNATAIVYPSQEPCGVDQATAIDVYSGHYTFANISNSTPLFLWNASEVPLCPPPIHFTYNFLPDSDNATVMIFPPAAVSEIVNETYTFSGYWARSGTSFPPSYSFQNFDAGQYTLSLLQMHGVRK